MTESHIARKPFGIVIIATYAGLYGVIEFILGFALIIAGSILEHSSTVKDGTMLILRGIFLSIFSVIQLTMTYGLWTLQLWGYNLAKLLIIISIPFSLITILADRSFGNMILQSITIAIAAWMLLYLCKPDTRSLFE